MTGGRSRDGFRHGPNDATTLRQMRCAAPQRYQFSRLAYQQSSTVMELASGPTSEGGAIVSESW